MQLYSSTNPNGAKAAMALEEMRLPYEEHLVPPGADDQLRAEFQSLNPNS